MLMSLQWIVLQKQPESGRSDMYARAVNTQAFMDVSGRLCCLLYRYSRESTGLKYVAPGMTAAEAAFLQEMPGKPFKTIG